MQSDEGEMSSHSSGVAGAVRLNEHRLRSGEVGLGLCEVINREINDSCFQMQPPEAPGFR